MLQAHLAGHGYNLTLFLYKSQAFLLNFKAKSYQKINQSLSCKLQSLKKIIGEHALEPL